MPRAWDEFGAFPQFFLFPSRVFPLHLPTSVSPWCAHFYLIYFSLSGPPPPPLFFFFVKPSSFKIIKWWFFGWGNNTFKKNTYIRKPFFISGTLRNHYISGYESISKHPFGQFLYQMQKYPFWALFCLIRFFSCHLLCKVKRKGRRWKIKLRRLFPTCSTRRPTGCPFLRVPWGGPWAASKAILL